MNESFKFLVVVLSFAFCLLSFNSPAQATTLESVSYTITVTATIGEPKLTLFGYTSPNALVELKGIRVSEDVIADQKGYFFFDRVFLPRPTPKYPELCLNSIDTQSRISFPTCLPSLPTGPFDISIGPVLLPPTISLEKGNFLPFQQVTAQGATIPNTEVAIYLYNADPSAGFKAFWLISPVLAYSLPAYKIQADENGNFEFNLPANRPNLWRVFASSFYLGSPSPKSNTLTFRVLSWWEWLLAKLKEILALLLSLLSPYLWHLIILSEIIILFWLWRRYKSSEADSHALG